MFCYENLTVISSVPLKSVSFREVFALKDVLMFLSTSSREFLYIRETIECGFTLKSVRDMIYLFVLFCQFKMSMNVKELLARSRCDI